MLAIPVLLICGLHWLAMVADAFTDNNLPRWALFVRQSTCPGQVVRPEFCPTVTTAHSTGLCAIQCTRDPECLGFVWGVVTGQCRQCNVLPDDGCGNTGTETGVIGYQMNNPCLNGGTLNAAGECVCTTAILGTRCHTRITDCEDVYSTGKTTDGVYDVHPPLIPEAFQVFCKIATNYRRTYFMYRSSKSFDFYRNWEEYRNGFGNPSSDHWLGLDKIHALTQQRLYKLFFQLSFANPGDFKQQFYYDFTVAGPESSYAINFTHTQPNSRYPLGDCLTDVIGKPFSTYDQDHDDAAENCAIRHHSGWWFGDCTQCNPTGVLKAPNNLQWSGDDQDVFWFPDLGNTVPKQLLMFVQRKNN